MQSDAMVHGEDYIIVKADYCYYLFFNPIGDRFNLMNPRREPGRNWDAFFVGNPWVISPTIRPLPGREDFCRRFIARTRLIYPNACIEIVGGEDAEQR